MKSCRCPPRRHHSNYGPSQAETQKAPATPKDDWRERLFQSRETTRQRVDQSETASTSLRWRLWHSRYIPITSTAQRRTEAPDPSLGGCKSSQGWRRLAGTGSRAGNGFGEDAQAVRRQAHRIAHGRFGLDNSFYLLSDNANLGSDARLVSLVAHGGPVCNPALLTLI